MQPIKLFEKNNSGEVYHTFIVSEKLFSTKGMSYLFVIAILIVTITLCLAKSGWIETRLIDKFNFPTGQGNIKYLSVSFYWAISAILVSIFSIWPLNLYSGKKAGVLESKIEEIESDYKNLDLKELKLAYWNLRGSYFLTIGTLIVLVLVILISWLHITIDFRIIGHDYGVLLLSIINMVGTFYLPIMLINDIIIYHSYVSIVRFTKDLDEGKIAIGKEDLLKVNKHLKSLIPELSIYGKLILFVDIPILFGIVSSFLTEHFVITDLNSKLLFSAGAMAMHVISANIISIIIDLSGNKRIG